MLIIYICNPIYRIRVLRQTMGEEMGEITPSENEWMIMEIVWRHEESVTASEIIRELEGILDVSQKTIRVMINRLVTKGVLTFAVDADDARIYHYTAARTKEECLKMKSERFVKHYFGGNKKLAVANFLHSGDITSDELDELEQLLQALRKR